MFKVCQKCKINKNVYDFVEDLRKKDKIGLFCKSCYFQIKKDKKKESDRLYYKKNKDILSLKHNKYKEDHKQELKIKNKKYRDQNPDIVSRWFILNRDRRLSYLREYNKNYKSIKNEKRNIRMKEDVQYRLVHMIRCRTKDALKRNCKPCCIIKNIGCSIEFLKHFLESKFHNEPGTNKVMSWQNQGKEWDIHHIIPLYKFNLSDLEQFKRAIHYTNLEPLWKNEHKERHRNR